ncbi:aldo/keto reductase [Zopfochytrium polystomum]|nr:aldo/keto reductase [Zopfochytrium polystomum]
MATSSSSNIKNNKKPLGRDGPLVAPVGLGAMGMSEFYGPSDDEENLRVLHHAIDVGMTFIDTADMYGSGANERLIAKVLKTRRSEVFLCTKFGNVRGPNGEFLGVRGDPDYVRECCKKSLERLEVDCIDLYYQHRVDPKTPIEDTVRAMAELVKEGKVKYLGLSEASAATIRRAYAVHPIAALQIEYSPWTTDIEQNAVLKTCEELGIAIVAYSPLGRGFLTGQIKSVDDLAPDDFRRFIPRFQGDNFAKNLKIVDELNRLAAAKGVAASQLTLAWVARQSSKVSIIPIPGTRKIERVNENWAAKDIVLTDDEDSAIRAIIDSFTVEGTRYAKEHMHTVNI